jgi:hypothetical protein
MPDSSSAPKLGPYPNTTRPSNEHQFGAGDFAGVADQQADHAREIVLQSELQAAVQHARTLLGGAGTALAITDEKGVVRRAGTVDKAKLSEVLRSHWRLSEECLRRRHTVFCADTNTDTRVEAAANETLAIRSIVVHPIILNGAVAGFIEAFSDKPNLFQRMDEIALTQITNSITRLLTNPNEVAESRNQIQQDTLTLPVLLGGRHLWRDRGIHQLKRLSFVMLALLILLLGWQGLREIRKSSLRTPPSAVPAHSKPVQSASSPKVLAPPPPQTGLTVIPSAKAIGPPAPSRSVKSYFPALPGIKVDSGAYPQQLSPAAIGTVPSSHSITGHHNNQLGTEGVSPRKSGLRNQSRSISSAKHGAAAVSSKKHFLSPSRAKQIRRKSHVACAEVTFFSYHKKAGCPL